MDGESRSAVPIPDLGLRHLPRGGEGPGADLAQKPRGSGALGVG